MTEAKFDNHTGHKLNNQKRGSSRCSHVRLQAEPVQYFNKACNDLDQQSAAECQAINLLIAFRCGPRQCCLCRCDYRGSSRSHSNAVVPNANAKQQSGEAEESHQCRTEDEPGRDGAANHYIQERACGGSTKGALKMIRSGS